MHWIEMETECMRLIKLLSYVSTSHRKGLAPAFSHKSIKVVYPTIRCGGGELAIVAQYAYQSPWYAYPYHSYSRTRTRHGWQGWAERGLEGTPRSSHRPPTHYHRQHTNYIIIYLLCDVEGLRATLHCS